MTLSFRESHLGDRLRVARLGADLSIRQVSKSLPSNLCVSYVTLNNYESGKSKPSVELLSFLATLYQRPLNWFLEKDATLTNIRYRNRKSRVGTRDLAKFEAICNKWLDAYKRIEEWVTQKGSSLQTKRTLDIHSLRGLPPHEAAVETRKQLNLNEEASISSVVEILEMAGIRTIEMQTDLAIDGFAAQLGDEDVVVLNTEVSNDRARMNAGHEMGHIVLGEQNHESNRHKCDKHEEDSAFEYASHLLLTSKMLNVAFERLSVVRLIHFKERYGISVAAMVYRAQKEGVIHEDTAKEFWIKASQLGWRKKEPGQVRPDRATRFEQILDWAISNNQLTWQQASSLTGIREDELRGRIDMAIGVKSKGKDSKKGGNDKLTLRLIK